MFVSSFSWGAPRPGYDFPGKEIVEACPVQVKRTPLAGTVKVCEKAFRLRMLVLKPFRYKEFRVSLLLCSAVLLTNLFIVRCLHTELMPRLKIENLYSLARDVRMIP